MINFSGSDEHADKSEVKTFSSGVLVNSSKGGNTSIGGADILSTTSSSLIFRGNQKKLNYPEDLRSTVGAMSSSLPNLLAHQIYSCSLRFSAVVKSGE